MNQKDGILGFNLFAYCNNNPIKYSDPTVHSIILACIIAGAVIGATITGVRRKDFIRIITPYAYKI